MEKRIALVTCSKYPNLTESDRVLATALAANGAKVSAIDWREHGDWSEFSVAVVRSTWDYHLHANEFNVSVDQVERATALINSPALLRWNSNKRYLLDLAKRHVRVLPCLVVRPGAEVPWRDLELAG